jgi:hypothetical protein
MPLIKLSTSPQLAFNYAAIFFLILLIAILNFNCSSTKGSLLVTKLDDFYSSDFAEENSCSDPQLYSPCIIGDYSSTKFIRVNFHFLNSEDGLSNYLPKEGNQLVRQLVNNANLRLRSNEKMNLPIGNHTPVCSPDYQYVIQTDHGDSGIFYHYDNDLCFFANKGKHRNNYDYTVIEKYSVGLDSVINVFIMPHIPEELQDKNYKSSRTGVALGNGLKIAGLFELKKEPWEFATLLNHEIGHILGLRHTWNTNDNCEDTPRHNNCWSSSGKGKCELASNNAMDYNNSQMAWTPCQLGLIHKSFNQLESTQRKLLLTNWCIKDTLPLIIDKNVDWNKALDINRDILIKSGNTLTVSCRLHMAQNTSIIIQPEATLSLNDAYLHNDCGHNWEGILIQTNGKKSGKLIATQNSILDGVAVESVQNEDQRS